MCAAHIWCCSSILDRLWLHANDKPIFLGKALASNIRYQVCLTSQRFPIAFQAIFAVISITGMVFLPDTPRWYYAKGLNEKGDDVLMRLHDSTLDDPAVQGMKSEILASIALEEEEHNKFSLLSLIWDKTELRAGRRIRISFMILSLQQMMGNDLSSCFHTV